MPDPVEATKEVAREGERGSSERTPAIALTGVTLAVALVVAVVLGIAALVYVLA